MLVLTCDKEILADGSEVQHAIKRYVERVAGSRVNGIKDIPDSDVKKLMLIIEEINLYLPDDWRMTRTQNNFRIFIQIQEPQTSVSFILAGNSFRQTNGNILHVIETVLRPEYFDQFDKETLVSQNDIYALPAEMRPEAYKIIRMNHPELVRPNLYFFKPHPEECDTPLFARQYERVFESDKEREFHRIHPLTKNGMDSNKFRWIRWTCFGEGNFVKSPDSKSHGRDYWRIPSTKFSRETLIKQEHAKLLKENDISYTKGENPDTPYEIEYKLMYTGEPGTRKELFKAAESIIKRNQFRIDSRKEVVQNDTYVDDDDFNILFGGGSFRVRKTSESARLTFKAKRSDTNTIEGKYARLEEEQTITFSDANALLQGHEINAVPFKALKVRFPSCGILKPRVKNETTRQILYIRNKEGQEAEVCFDFVRFFNLTDNEIGRDVEIEIESKGMPIIQIADLADKLENELDLKPSQLSKYERAFELLS